MQKDLAIQIKDHARQIGVNLIGICPAVFDEQGEKHLQNFIDKGKHGQMAYLEDYQKRVNPGQLLPGAQSVIVIAVNYYRQTTDIPKTHGRIARYAYGRDYHKVLKKILKQMVKFLEQIAPEKSHKICVDSAPILEKSYAQKAGLGFIGKNTTLITPQFGSFVLLGEIITTLKLNPGPPNGSSEANRLGRGATGVSRSSAQAERRLEPEQRRCGTCTRCLDSCPTKALTAPGQMDARRCISYLTIEHKGEIVPELAAKMGNRIFGCDICQEVCPYNKVYAQPLQLKEFRQIKIAGESIPLEEILNLKTDQEFLEKFAGSPLMRAKRHGLQRNALIAKSNSA